MQRELREAVAARGRHKTWANYIGPLRQATRTITLPIGLGKTHAMGLVMIDELHRYAPRTSRPENPQVEHISDAALPTGGLNLSPEPYAPRRMRVLKSDRERYRALSRRVLARERAGKHQERRIVTEVRRWRDSEARRAVLTRSRGLCENPKCLNPDLPYRTTAGEPLLQVDHIDEHASGGRDYPSAMIALCPNCHANKTHGTDREEWTELLRAEAAHLHARWA
ncbi:HNH endonuclease [Streptomyces marispadix]|uniref:HNH endonuclease n=1 Tax=Streptomyces marispadix TaxID=2922868 RepID=UPI003555CAAA